MTNLGFFVQKMDLKIRSANGPIQMGRK